MSGWTYQGKFVPKAICSSFLTINIWQLDIKLAQTKLYPCGETLMAIWLHRKGWWAPMEAGLQGWGLMVITHLMRRGSTYDAMHISISVDGLFPITVDDSMSRRWESSVSTEVELSWCRKPNRLNKCSWDKASGGSFKTYFRICSRLRCTALRVHFVRILPECLDTFSVFGRDLDLEIPWCSGHHRHLGDTSANRSLIRSPKHRWGRRVRWGFGSLHKVMSTALGHWSFSWTLVPKCCTCCYWYRHLYNNNNNNNNDNIAITITITIIISLPYYHYYYH